MREGSEGGEGSRGCTLSGRVSCCCRRQRPSVPLSATAPLGAGASFAGIQTCPVAPEPQTTYLTCPGAQTWAPTGLTSAERRPPGPRSPRPPCPPLRSHGSLSSHCAGQQQQLRLPQRRPPPATPGRFCSSRCHSGGSDHLRNHLNHLSLLLPSAPRASSSPFLPLPGPLPHSLPHHHYDERSSNDCQQAGH